jgi:hypothetical protein
VKYILSIAILLFFMNVCFGQFDKFVTLRATGHLNVLLNGLGMNEIGAGIGLDASLFSKGRLQMLFEGSTNHFTGDKSLRIDSITGRHAMNAAVYYFKVGPQYFITRNLAFAVTYGPSWHVSQDFEYTLDNGVKYSITGFWGPRQKVITRMSLSDIPNNKERIKYLSFAAGIRF